MKNILLYVWQLPQNILGLLLLLFAGGERYMRNGVTYYYNENFDGGISLGRYIILSTHSWAGVKHEHGHCIQSRLLGPLYLIVVGLPSILHAWICYCRNHSYYDFWCERWADRLAERE